MKKFVCLLISLLLLLSAVPAVFAASSASAWATQVIARRGEEVSVYVNLSTTETVSGLGISVGYDTAIFEYAGSAWTVANKVSLGEGKDFDPALGNGAVLISPASKPNGEIFCINLRVRDDAALGSSTVNFSVKVGSEGDTVYASADINVSCNHSWGPWQTVTEATCTAIGQQERVCSICGARQQSYIEAKGHDYSDWETTKEATCTEKGEQVRKCSVCGSAQARTVDPLGHKLGDDAKVLKEATCTEHGEASGTCTICGQNVTVSTPLAEHSYGEWYTIVQATCTEKGEREHECTVCGHVERQKSLPLGHDFSQGTMVSAATIYSTGLFEAKCSRCGIEGSIISPCSHTDEETGIYLETEEDVFPVGTIVKVRTLSETRPEEKEVLTGIEKYINQLKAYFELLLSKFKNMSKEAAEVKDYGMGSVSSSYDLYEIKAVNNDGDRVKQDGQVKVTFNLPEGFGRNISVFGIEEDGVRSELPVVVDMEKRTVTASADSLNVFALANLDALPEKEDLKAPMILHYLIEALLLIFLIISMSVSGGRRRRLKELRKESEEVKKQAEEQIQEHKEAAEKAKADAAFEKYVPSSLRDEINEALGETRSAPVPPEDPDKPKKPTLDDIFGEMKK